MSTLPILGTHPYGLCVCGHLGTEHERDRQHTDYGTCYAVVDYLDDGTALTCGETSRCGPQGFRRPVGGDPFQWPTVAGYHRTPHGLIPDGGHAA